LWCCLTIAAAKALTATFSGKKTGTLKPTPGATRVLLKVTVKNAASATRLKLKAGGKAKVKAPKGKTVTAYVVLKLGKGAKAKKLTASIAKRASVQVIQVGCY
jgi:hypothetical protein